ncbi:hypothetical protein CC79DRAFT_1289477 [Sarocladium strictum]
MAEQAQSTPSEGDQTTTDGLHIWSCVNCRRRKLRCDRHEPCANCVRSKIDCHFPVTGRIPRRSRQPATSPAQKQSELLGRLRRLEAVVTELSGQIEDGTIGSSSATSEDTASLWQKGNDPTEDFGSLVTDADGSLRVAKGFWSIFCTEVDNIFQAVADVADDVAADEPSTSDEGPNVEGATRGHHQRFVLGSPPASTPSDDVNLTHLHSHMLFLWQTFCDNVDPFITVLDILATTNMIHSIKGNFNTLSPEDRAQMISISLAAVVSLDEEEVSLNLGVPKPQLLAHLRLGTENALASATFMTTRSLVVAQAFAIYVSILPQLGATQLAAPMTAILVRVAFSLGLHKDPLTVKRGTPSRPAADIQTRRLLWWQVCFLDARVRHKDAPDLSISPTTATTKEPTDIEDGRTGKYDFTGISLCRVRCELWRLSHKIRDISKDDIESQQQLLSDTSARIRETYFSTIDKTDPSLASFANQLTNLFFAQIEYTIKSRQPRTEEQTADTLGAARDLMKTTYILNYYNWKMWHWQLQGYAPWSAMLTTLKILSRRTDWTGPAYSAFFLVRTIINVLPKEAHDLRILQVIKSRFEEMEKTKQQEYSPIGVPHPASDLDSIPGIQSPNQPEVCTAELELPMHVGVGVGNDESSLAALKESWNFTDGADDPTFVWGDWQETDDIMDWQFMDGTLDTSVYWGQQNF